MASESECIFCRIVRGDIPGTVVYQDADVVAFRDIQPAAPTHVLVVPRIHIASAAEINREHAAVLAALLGAINQVAELDGVATSGYRVVTNVGAAAGQTVPHLHFHVLGGRQLGAMG